MATEEILKNSKLSRGSYELLMDKLGCHLWAPRDPSSLAFSRIIFGLLMMIDIPMERGFSEVDRRFGDPKSCHFPLFDLIQPLSMQLMSLVYTVMWLGALGIMVGYHFRLSCLSFLIPYLYIFLLDKTSWNNHSYLYALLAILLTCSSANHYWSVDAWLSPSINNRSVPNWNYLLLRFQIFVLYFYAGVKKLDLEWLSGYPMKDIGKNYVFSPFRLFLSEDHIEFYIVHIGGFLLDLTLGFWLLWPKARPFAMLIGASFHLMNSRLFAIGMFPYVCLGTLPIFCDTDWPKRWLSRTLQSVKPAPSTKSNRLKTYLMVLYVAIQLTLPWSHGVTQGYNNWTNGLYGYSWDMMVHGWSTMHVVVTVEHKATGQISYIDTDAFVKNNKWVGHVDMIHQYAHCVKDRLEEINMTDIAVYVDVWRSLNGRFQQRLVDPRVDILSAVWSPWRPTSWLMPLLTELTPWRSRIFDLEQLAMQQSQSIRVAFVADFPGLSMENYVSDDVTSASVHVLEGQVDVVFENGTGLTLSVNDTVALPSKGAHLIHIRSQKPACYMYTYAGEEVTEAPSTPPAPQEQNRSVWSRTFHPFVRSADLLRRSVLNLVFGVPLAVTT